MQCKYALGERIDHATLDRVEATAVTIAARIFGKPLPEPTDADTPPLLFEMQSAAYPQALY
ncbi:MAG: hypothetical protein WC627_02700 [Legionella sp.]|jgi:hypothetical protein